MNVEPQPTSETINLVGTHEILTSTSRENVNDHTETPENMDCACTLDTEDMMKRQRLDDNYILYVWVKNNCTHTHTYIYNVQKLNTVESA